MYYIATLIAINFTVFLILERRFLTEHVCKNPFNWNAKKSFTYKIVHTWYIISLILLVTAIAFNMAGPLFNYNTFPIGLALIILAVVGYWVEMQDVKFKSNKDTIFYHDDIDH